ncbi:hypothetical protein ALQ89_100709 [Pseudomonas amygdali pv. tabaci]|uniref:Uncharacterized protein n=2 Tax=Pseudomonas amygdali TaxID=47877 RepID=A0AAX1W205_PSEAJ|nr:hypothetical protein ALO35_102623 [Pseudomonas amygdali pv. lachrymans]KPY85242.1 hypothetical protein ALO60_102046 [Pseudomonas amygdali pv. tabaci]RML84263.1 hypothetical protein ALQ89_100709 [Pseudomonas amygdali pv. tabaci]RMR85369.1 hypothetical protein ALP77_101927 [Pseudomonas amygdali pv. tabaci]
MPECSHSTEKTGRPLSRQAPAAFAASFKIHTASVCHIRLASLFFHCGESCSAPAKMYQNRNIADTLSPQNARHSLMDRL